MLNINLTYCSLYSLAETIKQIIKADNQQTKLLRSESLASKPSMAVEAKKNYIYIRNDAGVEITMWIKFSNSVTDFTEKNQQGETILQKEGQIKLKPGDQWPTG
jgi:hypothetical protein